MLSYREPKRIFLLALSLLLLSAASASWMIYRLFTTENLVRHTYNVLLAIDSVASDLAKASRYRTAFLENADRNFADEFSTARAAVNADIEKLRAMLSGNPQELEACDKLESVVSMRLATLQRSIERKMSGVSDSAEQADSSNEELTASFEAAAISGQMKEVEENLLEKRALLTNRLFVIMLGILLLTFSLSVVLLCLYYWSLSRELKERSHAEANAQRLSVLVMTMQDEERRKFARELHDSLGQNLTAAKILADQLIRKLPGEKGLMELQSIVTETLTETRTISHLLHPPLLDEMGFATAARWFIEGYAKRTGIPVTFEIPDEPQRLTRIAELTLFRVLQESLTNIHRHSRSKNAEVRYSVNEKHINLQVSDFGIGIPDETLSSFTLDGSRVGIGLAGMRERVREQGGVLSVKSGPEGTTVTATFPTPKWTQAPAEPWRSTTTSF